MTPKVLAALATATQTGFLLRPPNDRACAALNAWWRLCRLHRWPYVVVQRAEGKDWVEMDLYEYHRRPTFEALGKAIDEVEKEFQAIKPVTKRRKRWIVGSYGEVFTRFEVPKGYGDRLAVVLREIAEKGAPKE
jgi:hypothetical protein